MSGTFIDNKRLGPLKDNLTREIKDKIEGNSIVEPSLPTIYNSPTFVTPFRLGKQDLITNTPKGRWFGIETSNPKEIKNVIEREIKNVAYDDDDLADIKDWNIVELVPPVSELPDAPPIQGKLRVANWAQLIKNAGSNDPNWSFGDYGTYGRQQKPWNAALKGVNPTYLFYEHDNPIFYCIDAVSHFEEVEQLDEDTGQIISVSQPIQPDTIIWR